MQVASTNIQAPTSKFSYFSLSNTGNANGGYSASQKDVGSLYVGSASSTGNSPGTYCASFGVMLYNLPNREEITSINSVSFSIYTRNSTSGYNNCYARIEYIGTEYNNYPPDWRVGASSERIFLEESKTHNLTTTDSATCANFLNIIQNAVSGQYYFFRLVRESGMGATTSSAITLSIDYEIGNRRRADFFVWTTVRTPIDQPPGPMTSASSQGCVVSRSSEYSSNYPAWRAFDDDLRTRCWASTNTATVGKWIQLKMAKSLYDLSVTITNRADNEFINGIVAGTIQGSNDGSTWVDICSFSGRDGSTAALSTTHICDNTTIAYQYVKIVESERAVPSEYVAIGQINISGYEYPSSGHWEQVSPLVYQEGTWTETTPYTYI